MMNPEYSIDPRTQQTINLYNQVIEDVIESIKKDWVQSGNDLRTLDRVRDLWRYRALKVFNIPGMVEPQGFRRNSTAVNSGQTMDDIINSMFGPISSSNQPQQAQEENDGGSDEEDDDDGFDDVGDDDNVDLNANDDEPDKRTMDVDSSSTESEEDEEDSETDPEIRELTTAIEAKDQILCHYTNRKSKAGGTIDDFDLSLLHLVIDGKPFVIKEGKLTTRNNKQKKNKPKKQKT